MNIGEILGQDYLGNTPESWMWAIVTAVIVALVFNFVLKKLVRMFAEFAEGTKTDLDDLISTLVAKTSLVLIMIFSVYVATFFLEVTEQIKVFRRTVIVIAMLVQVGFWGSGFTDYYIGKRLAALGPEAGASITHVKSLGFLAKSILWVLLVILAADNLGFDPTTIIAGLGIGGIAIALALQNVLGDLIASLSIILDKPFAVGDFIVVDDLSGNVENIGLKTTRLRSLSGEQLVLSNNDLLQSRVKNYKRMNNRRVVFTLGVEYETSYDLLVKIPDIVKEIISEEPKARFGRAHFSGYGDFSLNHEIVYFVLTPLYGDYMDMQQNINLKIFRKFAEEGIEFAYPTSKVFLESANSQKTELVEGNPQ